MDFLIHWPPGPVVATVQCQGLSCRRTIMKTCPKLLAAISSSMKIMKLGPNNVGNYIQELSDIVMVPRSTSLLVLLSSILAKGCSWGLYTLQPDKRALHNMTHLSYLNYDLTFQVTVLVMQT